MWVWISRTRDITFGLFIVCKGFGVIASTSRFDCKEGLVGVLVAGCSGGKRSRLKVG